MGSLLQDVVKNQHPALDSDILQTERAGRVAIITLCRFH